MTALAAARAAVAARRDAEDAAYAVSRQYPGDRSLRRTASAAGAARDAAEAAVSDTAIAAVLAAVDRTALAAAITAWRDAATARLPSDSELFGPGGRFAPGGDRLQEAGHGHIGHTEASRRAHWRAQIAEEIGQVLAAAAAAAGVTHAEALGAAAGHPDARPEAHWAIWALGGMLSRPAIRPELLALVADLGRC